MEERALFVKLFYLLSTGKVILEDNCGKLYACEEDPDLFHGGCFGEEYQKSALVPADRLNILEQQELDELLILNAKILPPLRVYAKEVDGRFIIGHERQTSLFVSVFANEIEHISDRDRAQLGDMVGLSSIVTPHEGKIEQDMLFVL